MGAKTTVRIGLAVFVAASLVAMNASRDFAAFIAEVSRQPGRVTDLLSRQVCDHGSENRLLQKEGRLHPRSLC